MSVPNRLYNKLLLKLNIFYLFVKIYLFIQTGNNFNVYRIQGLNEAILVNNQSNQTLQKLKTKTKIFHKKILGKSEQLNFDAETGANQL